jgi:hypothetical protein
MAKPGTIPVTTILSRDLRKWLENAARKEDKKLGPYIRKVLETHRAAVDAVNPNVERNT